MTNSLEGKAEQVLVTLLEKAVAGIDAAVAFSQAQIPDVIAQLLAYKIWDYSLTISVCLSLVIACVLIFKKSKKLYDNNNELGLVGMIFSFCLGAVILSGTFVKIKYLVMLIVAPKLYLIQYAADLIGGNNV